MTIATLKTGLLAATVALTLGSGITTEAFAFHGGGGGMGGHGGGMGGHGGGMGGGMGGHGTWGGWGGGHQWGWNGGHQWGWNYGRRWVYTVPVYYRPGCDYGYHRNYEGYCIPNYSY